MKNNFCARKTRQLSYRVKLLKNYSANSEKSDSKIQKLISEIKELIQSLKFSISRRRIRKIVGSAAVLLGIGLGPTVQAQQFASEIINPFGIMLATDTSWPPTLCDFDGDGDIDLLVNDYNVDAGFAFHENVGTAQSPSFATGLLDQFGLPDMGTFLPLFGDLDNDGDLDLLAFGYDSNDDPNANYYENVGTPGAPSFSATPIENPFNLTSNYVTTAQFVDIDNDGDLDLITTEYGFNFFQNSGTPESPNFEELVDSPFGLTNPNLDKYIAFEFSDVDLDGDLDMLGVETYSDENGVANFIFQRNTGDAEDPAFSDPVIDPFGLSPLTESYVIFPTMADLDGDGDEDLLISYYKEPAGSDGDYVFDYYELVSAVQTENIISNNSTTVFPNPTADILTIDSDINIESFEIFDMVGRQILSENFNGQTINVKALNTGLYVIKFKNEKEEIVVKRFEKI